MNSNSINWDEVLIRCSSLSCLFTEPQKKEDKEAGKLSKTAQTHLIEVYAREIWGVEKDLVTKQMQKGIVAEEDGINLLRRVDKKYYTKNEDRRENEWICGHCDIEDEDEIIDTKLSWDAFTFLPKLIESVDKTYEYQLQGYMWLWDKSKARIAYCLVDTPENIREGEKYRLLRSMDVVTEESPEFLKAWRKLESNMKFGHIPPHHRVICHEVKRNEEIISQIPAKVTKAREFLAQLSEIHQAISPAEV